MTAATPEGAAAGARTFLIADIRGYTAYTAEHGDDAAAALANKFADLTREIAEAHEGFVIELRGDEALCAFVSARQALRAALAMQERYRAEVLPRGVGIGIDSGEAIPMDSGGFRGTALNLAARLCAQAKPGQIIASEAVIHLAARVDGIAYVESRTIRLKGYDDPVRAVDVVPVGDARVRRGPPRRRPTIGKGVLIGGVAALLAVALGAVALSGAFSPKPSAGPGATGTAPPVAGASPTRPAQTASVGPSSTVSATTEPTPAASEGPIATEDLPLLAFIDPSTGQVTATRPAVPGLTDDSKYIDGAFWQLGLTPKAFYRIDPATQQLSATIAVPITSDSWWTVNSGVIWVTDQNRPRVVAVDTATGSLIHDFDLAPTGDGGANDEGRSSGVAVGAGSVWVVLADPQVVKRVDVATGEIQDRIRVRDPNEIAFGNDAIWVTGNGRISRIDPQTNEVTFTTLLRQFHEFPFVTFSSDAAWTADEVEGTVYKIDRSGAILGRFETGAGARPLQYMDGKVWVANQDAGTISAIDANTGSIDTYSLGHQVTNIAAGAGVVLVAVQKSPEDVFAELPGKVLKLALNNDVLQAPAPDSATNPYPYNRMVLYATCSRLLDYGDVGGSDSYTLRPEVAAAMPELSADGLTYTFTVKPGFGFSPPSTEEITAETYRYAMERALSPALGHDGRRAIDVWSDIEGAVAFNDGTADHVTGLVANGDKLSVTLTAPASDFLARLMLSYSCPVPLGTPAVPALDPTTPVPGSGPFYLSVHAGGEFAILERNPNYGGQRHSDYDTIALRFGIAEGETPTWADDGRADVAINDLILQAGTDLASEWGPDGAHAAQGDQRWYPIPYPGSDYLLLNPRGKLTSDPIVRSAIALALDRGGAAQSFFEPGTSTILNESVPIQDAPVAELVGPDAEAARALLAGRTGTLRMAVQQDCDQCLDSANSIKSNMAAIGLTVEIVNSDDPFTTASNAKSNIDLFANYSQPFYPDAAVLLDEIVSSGPDGWFSDDQIAAGHALLSLTGAERDQAAADLAQELTAGATVIPYGLPADGVYFGPTVGCRTIIAGIIQLDLVALCPATP